MSQKRKIRFIEPHGRPGRPFNAWIGHWPLLGPVVLATILHEKGFDAAVYNENVCGPLEESPQAYADVCSADVVGISIMTPTSSRGYALAEQIRKENPRATIVFGGVHASFLPEEALPHGDVVVVGEGENVIEAIASGEIRSGIVRPQPPQDLDALPALNYSLLIGFDRILKDCGRRDRYELPVMASRGCPHGCTYCSVTRMFGRKVRRQSPEKVHADLLKHMEAGYRRFFFYDDNFTSDRAWSKDLLERIRPLRIRFNAQTRIDFGWKDASRKSLDVPLLQLMNKAGGDVLYVGYETIDDRTAAHWNKGYRGALPLRRRLMEATKILHDYGFWIHAMFVLGPQHDEQNAKDIVRFSQQAGIETMQISILTPFPGTPLFEQMRPNLFLTDFPNDWDFYDGTHCVYDNSVLGLEQLQHTLLRVHRTFYRWGWSLRRVRSLAEDRIPPMDKIRKLWRHLQIARTTMQQWRQDTSEYLAFVKERLAREAKQLIKV